MGKIDKKIKIVVAMSGGVDSSVAAALLKKQGFFVMGVFMKFWHAPRSLGGVGKEYNRCCSVESEKMARLVAKQLDIPFYVLNVENDFKKKVVDYFLKEYKNGNTPNPCVVCNKEIKFGLLIEKALKMGADFVATGHYVQTSLSLGNKLFSNRSPNQIFSRLDLSIGGNPRLKKIYLVRSVRLLEAKDKNKDQSYFLWQLNQKQLSKVLFPVGNYTKPQVRALAKKFNLPTAETPESQEVCFVQDTTNNFLEKCLKIRPGKIVELGRRTSQKIIGEHKGLWFYTIGQRKGIGLSGGPYYVVAKDFRKNNLIVSKNKNDLLQKEFVAKNVNWISGKEPKLPIKVKVRIRYRSNLASARIMDSTIRTNGTIKRKGEVKVIFDKPQKAVTPGQSAVFYKGEELLGGGIIK